MSRVDGGRSAQAQRTEQVAEQNRAGQLPPGMEPGGKAGALGQVTKGQIPVGPDGKPLTTDGMTAGTQTQAPTVTVANQGLQAGSGTNPFGNLPLGQQVSAEAMRLSEALVGMDLELELPPDVLGKLLGLEKRAAQKGGKFSLNPKLQQAGERMREGTMLMVSDASVTAGDGAGDGDVVTVRDTKTIIAGKVMEFGAEVKLANAKEMKNAMFAQRSAFPMGMDVHAFVKAVLREAYMLQNEELLDRGRKMEELNNRKRELRAKTRRAEELKFRVLSGDATEEELDELSDLLGFARAGDEPISNDGGQGSPGGVPGGAGSPQQSGLNTGAGSEVSSGQQVFSEDASRILDTTTVTPPKPAGYDAAKELGAIMETPGKDVDWYTGEFLVWLGINGAVAEDAISSAAALTPDQFARLADALQNLDYLIDGGYESQSSFGTLTDWTFAGAGVEHAHAAGQLLIILQSGDKDLGHRLVNKLIENGTAEQIDALRGHFGEDIGYLLYRVPDLDSRERPVLDSKNENPFDAGTAPYTWQGMLDLRGPSDPQFLFSFHHGSPEDQRAFLAVVGPELIEAGKASELELLFQALPASMLVGDSARSHFGWLNSALGGSSTGGTESDFISQISGGAPNNPIAGLGEFVSQLEALNGKMNGGPTERAEALAELLDAGLIDTLTLGSSSLEPATFAELLTFLVAAGQDGGGEPVEMALSVMVSTATPSQLKALEGIEGLSDSLAQLVAADANVLLNRAQGDLSRLGGTEGQERKLLDLYFALDSSNPVSERLVMDQLRYQLAVSSVEDAAAFFDKVGPELVASGNGAYLNELLSALPGHYLSGENLESFGWLNDVPAELSTGSLPDPGGAAGTSSSSTTTSGATNSTDGAETDEAGGAGRPKFEENTFYNDLMTEDEKETFLSMKLQELEDESESIGFDQQMMQMELQDLMQKQQQFLTMMSNMSKMMHDVAMSIIRNIGG